MKLVCLVLFSLLSGTLADEGDAKIILIKNILNDIITEGQDLAVEYSLFNIGDG